MYESVPSEESVVDNRKLGVLGLESSGRNGETSAREVREDNEAMMTLPATPEIVMGGVAICRSAAL